MGQATNIPELFQSFSRGSTSNPIEMRNEKEGGNEAWITGNGYSTHLRFRSSVKQSGYLIIGHVIMRIFQYIYFNQIAGLLQ